MQTNAIAAVVICLLGGAFIPVGLTGKPREFGPEIPGWPSAMGMYRGEREILLNPRFDISASSKAAVSRPVVTLCLLLAQAPMGFERVEGHAGGEDGYFARAPGYGLYLSQAGITVYLADAETPATL